MLKVIYTSTFHCTFCDKDISLNVLSGDNTFKVDQDVIDVADAANKQYHSEAEHTVCAICGEAIRGGDSELIIGSTYKGEIHPNYDQYASFNKDREMLNVHKSCTGTRLILD